MLITQAFINISKQLFSIIQTQTQHRVQMVANILNEHGANMMLCERSTVQYMSNILPHALHKGHLAVAHEIAGGYLFNDQSHGYLEFIFLLLRQ